MVSVITSALGQFHNNPFLIEILRLDIIHTYIFKSMPRRKPLACLTCNFFKMTKIVSKIIWFNFTTKSTQRRDKANIK